MTKKLELENFDIDIKSIKRKVPVYSILYSMIEEQKLKIEDNLININFLTKEQLKEVEETLSFDRELEKIWHKTKESVHKFL